jgi:hypothetical protein
MSLGAPQLGTASGSLRDRLWSQMVLYGARSALQTRQIQDLWSGETGVLNGVFQVDQPSWKYTRSSRAADN